MVSDPNLYIVKLDKSSTVAFSSVKNLAVKRNFYAFRFEGK